MIDFAAPGFLYALPAALIPLVIHLLFRRRFRRVEWAAMEHLLRAERRARRSIRWRNLLLLALRVGAVVLLVLVFSRPLIGGALAGLGAGARGTGPAFLLLDDSPSMEHAREGESAFDRAARFAGELGRTLSGEASRLTAFVSSGAEPFYDASAGSADAAALATALDGLRTSAVPLRPEQNLPALGSGATERGADEPRFYVVSDLRAVDWGRESIRPGARAGLEALLKHGPVTLVDVGAPAAGNAGLSELRAAGRFVYPGERTVFRVVVENDSGSALDAGRLEVALDGSALPPVPHPQVPPGERREVPVAVRAETPGSHGLAVRLTARDAFPPDDARYLAFSAVSDVRVLVLEGRVGAATYLRAALRPAEGGRGLRAEVRPWVGAAPPNLSPYAALFVCGVRDPSLLADALTTYVRDGGRVAVFLGPDAVSEAWGRTLLDPEEGILPAHPGARPMRPGEAIHLSQLDFSHPLLAPFEEWERLFRAARFEAYWPLEAVAGTRVLGRFDDEASSPAVLAHELGDGVALLFASSADDAWNDWARSEAGRVTYVSLMHWLVEYARQRDRTLNLVGGERLTYRLDPSEFRPEAMLRQPGRSAPEGQALSAGPLEEGPGRWFVAPPSRRAGIGELSLRALDGSTRRVSFAVNIPRRERELDPAPPELFRVGGLEGRLNFVRYDGTARAGAEERLAETRLWPPLLGVLLAVLLAESLAAYLFGNPRDGGRDDR